MPFYRMSGNVKVIIIWISTELEKIMILTWN